MIKKLFLVTLFCGALCAEGSQKIRAKDYLQATVSWTKSLDRPVTLDLPKAERLLAMIKQRVEKVRKACVVVDGTAEYIVFRAEKGPCKPFIAWWAAYDQESCNSFFSLCLDYGFAMAFARLTSLYSQVGTTKPGQSDKVMDEVVRLHIQLKSWLGNITDQRFSQRYERLLKKLASCISRVRRACATGIPKGFYEERR